MENAQRVRREVHIHNFYSSSPKAAGPQAQDARPFGSSGLPTSSSSDLQSFDGLSSATTSTFSPSTTSPASKKIYSITNTHSPSSKSSSSHTHHVHQTTSSDRFRNRDLPSIPSSPPELYYSSGSEYSSSDPDLPSTITREAVMRALPGVTNPSRSNSNESYSDISNYSDSKITASSRRDQSHSHSKSQPHNHSYYQTHTSHSRRPTTPSSQTSPPTLVSTPSQLFLSSTPLPASETRTSPTPLRRSASSSTALRSAGGGSNVVTQKLDKDRRLELREREKEGEKDKRSYFPEGQRAGSKVPLSFSGEYDDEGNPIFVDDLEKGLRLRSQSAPTSSDSDVKTPTIVLQEVGNTLSTKKKRTLTIFDTYSFPLPPTPNSANRSPIPRSPGHRATASESHMLHHRRAEMSTQSHDQQPTPVIPPTLPAIKALQQSPTPKRSHSQNRHRPRPLPATPSLSSSKGHRQLGPRSASAGGNAELESFLSLHSPVPSAALPKDDKANIVDVVGVSNKENGLLAPPQSARGKDMGITTLIGLLDAAIVVPV